MARTSAKTTGRKTIRLSIDISLESEIRLHGIARRRGCGKLELAARLLEQSIRRYKDEDPVEGDGAPG